MIIIVCGVSGTGKSTIGKLLADTLQLPFYDGDDFHPKSNVQKMQNGIALNDQDRAPWLNQLSTELAQWESEKGAVLACSALKESYREMLSTKCKAPITWIVLNGSKALLTERLDAREGHFFDSHMLTSQLNTLELPDYGLVINVALTPEEIVDTISAHIQG